MKASISKSLSLIFLLSAAAVSAHADDCDGIRDSLKNLPATGGQVLIPAGTYNCESPIILDKSHVQLIGAGQNKTIIRLADNKHAPLLIIGDAVTVTDSNGRFVPKTYVNHIKVSGMTLDGNRLNHDTSKECGEHSCDGDTTSVRNNGITIRGASYITVSNVTAHSMISGGMVTEKICSHLKVTNFESYDNFYDGLAGYETEKSEFSHLNLHNNKGAGVSIDINFSHNLIHDSQIHNNHDVGIFARDQVGNHFVRVDIRGNGNFGVFLARGDRAAENTCASDMVFDTVTITGSNGAPFRVNDECYGNKIIGRSNICGNLENGVSEAVKDSTIVGADVRCR